ncbi:putative phage tail protein [Paenibacillus paeoniae]|uniref:DUF2313 domain-containing protein n=1 Tax=Paenibacillus paeoniae TaxID=2292705 RepID=A0A371PEL7_9BACL|nr:putative phage tail protein [Paenibacillus paeoniae]REK74393.1 DUF2313 domain-containing protein [Paenibacillus paeoniae]
MVYGESQHGLFSYGSSLKAAELPETEKVQLIDYLPHYWRQIRDMVELQATLSEEVGQAWSNGADGLLQQFVSTATWGLDNWEKELGLSTDISMTPEWRREIIIAKLRGHGTLTKQKLIAIASAFSGGEVDVKEFPAENRFVVQFIGILGVPANMAGFVQTLEAIKPAHLSVSFVYTFTTWDMVSGLNWQQAGTRTWNQLRTYGGE